MIARAVVGCIGARWACLAVVLACAVLTYGGVSLFVVSFSIYPLAVQLFRAADLPRRYIPASIAFGSITFTRTAAGSPEIQNLIPIQYLVSAEPGEPLTDARAGWPVRLIVAVLMFAAGQTYLECSMRRAPGKNTLSPGTLIQTHWRVMWRLGPLRRRAAVGRRSRPPTLQPSLVRALLAPAMTLAALNVLPQACNWVGA